MFSRLGTTIAVMIMLAVGLLLFLATPPPNPRGPQCLEHEIAVQANGQWWCVMARKPQVE